MDQFDELVKHHGGNNSVIRTNNSSVGFPAIPDVRRTPIQQLCMTSLITGIGNITRSALGKNHNTTKSYDPVEDEYNQYCQKIHFTLRPDEIYKVTPEQVLFIFDVCYISRKEETW